MDNSVFPTKGNLIATKKSHKLSKLGFELLDKKRVILINELMKYLSKAQDIRKNVDELFKDAYTSLQKANIIMGISNIDSCAKSTPIDNGLIKSEKSIMGIAVPVIKFDKNQKNIPSYGLFGTDDALDDAFCKFNDIKVKLLELSEIENTVFKLAYGISKVSKRANALQNVMIPKFENRIKTISDVLEEKEREEFSRLKLLKKD
jgi:V/A-type H+-transporting ATPase subunit D